MLVLSVDVRTTTEIISLTQKALPKPVSARSFAASIRHKTNDLFIPICGIGLAPTQGISPRLGITTESCRFVLTRSIALFILVEKAVHYGRAATGVGF
jgi:hypothetical protein